MVVDGIVMVETKGNRDRIEPIEVTQHKGDEQEKTKQKERRKTGRQKEKEKGRVE